MDVKNAKKTKTPLISSQKLLTFTKRFGVYPLNALLSFLLSKGVIFNISAPFGLSVIAACGSSCGSLCSLIGATIGYITMLDRINSLKYIACLILVFTAHFIFTETSLIKHRLFPALSVIIPTSCVNLIFIADAGFPLFFTLISIFEIIVAAICAKYYTYIVKRNTQHNANAAMGFLILAVTLVIPLYDITIMDIVSLGRIISFSLIMLSAFTGGLGYGAFIGILFGTALSLTSSSIEYSMICGILGISIALTSKRNKIICILSSSILTFFISACIDISAIMQTSLEITVSAIIFIICSDTFSKHTRKYFQQRTPHRDSHLRSYTSKRLDIAANAFRSLGKLLGETHHRCVKDTELSIESIFSRTSCELCKKCKLNSVCWERDFESTRDAITKAIQTIKEKGTLSSKDFPIHFSSRCLNIENFINIINREIFAIRYRNQFSGRLKESYELLTRQYSETSAIFSSISSDISETLSFDENAESEIRDTLASHGILCDTAVYRDFEGHLNIHLCGKDLSYVSNEFHLLRDSFAASVGTPVLQPQYTHGERLDDIIIHETPKFRGSFAAAVKRRSGSDISGDSGSFFRPTNSKLAILLSDGMGSGKLAARESVINISLLENLLKAGISPQNALETLQSALILKSEYTGVFSTLDLTYIDIFTGNCDIFKFGGAPTYIKRGRHIRRISSSSLPAGMSIGKPLSPDKTSLTLCSGDFVIMTSDGICDGNDDTKLLEFLSKTNEASPKSLADALLAYSIAVYGKNDDMTIAVLLIESDE